MAKKVKFDELMKHVDEAPPLKKKQPKTSRRCPQRRRHKRNKSDSLDVEMIRKWIPHLIACDFDRIRSVELAFPTIEFKGREAGNFTYRLITHPMFTDIIAAHMDGLDAEHANSERYVLDRLYRQAEANIFDYFNVDTEGHLTVKSLAELEPWQQKNVKKMKVVNKVVEHGLSRRLIEQTIDLEVVDSFKPVALLGKNMGMFVERIEMNLGQETANRLQAALERVKEKRLEQSDGRKQLKDQSGAARTIN